jgi:uncharacterized protein (TIGR03000 family)
MSYRLLLSIAAPVLTVALPLLTPGTSSAQRTLVTPTGNITRYGAGAMGGFRTTPHAHWGGVTQVTPAGNITRYGRNFGNYNLGHSWRYGRGWWPYWGGYSSYSYPYAYSGFSGYPIGSDTYDNDAGYFDPVAAAAFAQSLAGGIPAVTSVYSQIIPALTVVPPSPPAEQPMTAAIDVQVPPNARVWVDGVQTKQTGPTRRFVTPTLTPGVTYQYEIRAAWNDGGKEVTRTQHLTFQAGDSPSVTFVAAPQTPAPAATAP